MILLFLAIFLITKANNNMIPKMNKIARIQSVLDRLYPNPPVPLNYKCEFSFLCAVVLSAQTTDGKVNNVTDTLFTIAPTPYDMVKMTENEILKVIQPVGLAPSKSRYLLGLSKMLIEKFNGKVPSSFEDLKSLPGVGHKTASVVRSHIFGHPSLAVDTHVHRLALRWGLTKEAKNPDKVQNDLCELFPQLITVCQDSWSKLHLQMIYFGREYCTAKQHINKECPMCSWIHSNNSDINTITSQTKTKITKTKKIKNNMQQPEDSLSDDKDVFEHIFTPKKISKGIISYSSREEEISQSPQLTPTLDSNSNNNNDASKSKNIVTHSVIEQIKIKPYDIDEKLTNNKGRNKIIKIKSEKSKNNVPSINNLSSEIEDEKSIKKECMQKEIVTSSQQTNVVPKKRGRPSNKQSLNINPITSKKVKF